MGVPLFLESLEDYELPVEVFLISPFLGLLELLYDDFLKLMFFFIFCRDFP